MFQNLPGELLSYCNWINWRYELAANDKWTKIPYSPITNHKASPANPADWSTYEKALERVDDKTGLGFVFSQTPFVGIDLDNKTQDEKLTAYHNQLIQYFHSYTEWSPSGRGTHTIVRATIPKSMRAPGIEVYAGHHYFTMTGNVLVSAPIQPANLLWLYGSANQPQAIHESEATESDGQIVQQAVGAHNGDKFRKLFYKGDRSDYLSAETGSPDASAADQALMNILAFYTQDRVQLKRIFRMSALKRPKTAREDYLDRTVSKALDQSVPRLDLAQIKMSRLECASSGSASTQGQTHTLQNLTYPPGLMGEIARYIYSQAHKPAHEIAIAGAIALMAGICGRAYSVNKAGLNQYVILLAETGRGKEIVGTAVSELLAAVASNGEPLATKFAGPGRYASGEGIIKELGRAPIPSFVSVLSEMAAFMRRICSTKANPKDEGIRQVLLDVYSKSGPSSILNPMVYSDALKNTSIVRAPNLTLIGESTPNDFYESFDANMITVGLLPRLLLIEYTGLRPPTNEHKPELDRELLEKLTTLISYSVRLNSTNKFQPVVLDEEAQHLARQYDLRADQEINTGSSNVHAEIWNRSHLKLLKLAATVAVGINYLQPVVTGDVLRWAMSVVDHGTYQILKRFEDGQLGTPVNPNRQYADVLAVLDKWFQSTAETHAGKAINTDARALGFVPYWYVAKELRRRASFTQERDPMWAIDKTLKMMVAEGTLSEIDNVSINGRKQRNFRYHRD